MGLIFLELRGVAIYVRDSIKFKIVERSPIGSPIDYLFIEIKCSPQKVLLGAVYRPNKSIDITPLTSKLDELSFVSSLVILVGDFNCNVLKD